jgi:hypothetical protein
VIHREIDCLDRSAAVAGRGRNQHDRLAGAHLADAMNDRNAHQVEAREGLIGELIHAGERQLLVMHQLERFDAVTAANLADKGADSA